MRHPLGLSLRQTADQALLVAAVDGNTLTGGEWLGGVSAEHLAPVVATEDREYCGWAPGIDSSTPMRIALSLDGEVLDLVSGQQGRSWPSLRRFEPCRAQAFFQSTPATLHPGAAEPFLAITVEVQLSEDDTKPFSWLLYHAGQHYRLRVPCFLLVVTNDPTLAAWAAGPFRSGMVTLRPLVLGPADIPAIIDPEDAQRSLHRTLLSGIVHGHEPIAVDIGLALAAALDVSPDDAGLFYWDALLASLDEAIRKALEMQLQNWKPRSEWGKRFLANALAEANAEGRAKGEAEGRAQGRAKALTQCILDLLEARGLAPDPTDRQRITTCTDLERLGQWFHRATTATSTAEVFHRMP